MALPASHCLELCDGGRSYRFRSLQALRALLGLYPPYDECLAYAPYARNAPHCSRPINRAKAAQVPSLIDRLQNATIPSEAAEGLLKTLSTHAVCGITGWHQNKATEVYADWQRELWDECLRINGLDPRQWVKPAPSMLGWDSGLNLARKEQGWETEEDYSEEDYGDDDDSEEDDSEDDVVSLSGGSITDSDTASDFDEQDISFGFEDGDSSSAEIVATPDTTISDFDVGDSPDFSPSTSSQYSSTSGGIQDSLGLPTNSQITPTSTANAHYPVADVDTTPDPMDNPPAASAGNAAAAPDESDTQEEGGSSEDLDEVDEFTTCLLDIDVSVFRGPDAAVPDILPPVSTSVSTLAGFRLYPQAPSPASQLKQLLNLMTQTVSQQRRYAGVLYGFARPSAPGMLKIGVVKDEVVARRPFADPVHHRLAAWQAQCGHPVVEVFRRKIACAAAERIESLVHLALREHRRIEDPPCGRCERRKRATRARTGGRCGGGKHDEWFEVDTGTAVRVVELWAAFAEQLPYDRFGRLVDFWSAKVEAAKARIGPGDTVHSWQETIPRLAEERTRTELADLVGRLYV